LLITPYSLILHRASSAKAPFIRSIARGYVRPGGV